MSQEIILSKLYLTNVFKFFFYRNAKVFRTLGYLIFILLASFAYFVVFLTKITYIVSMFDSQNYSNAIFLILVLVVLLIICGWLIFAFIRLFKQSKYSFLDDIQKTYSINSTEMVTIESNVITSKNSQNNHMYVYNLTDITRTYVSNGLLIIQFCDDNFIFLNANKEILSLEEIKKHKKHFLKTTKKEEE